MKMTSKFFLALTAGTCLFATQAFANAEHFGKKAGQKIDEAKEKIEDKSKQAWDNTKELAEKTKEKAKDVAEDAKDGLEHAHDKSKETAHKLIDKA